MEPINLAATGAGAAANFVLQAYKNAGIAYDYIRNPLSAEVHNSRGRGCSIRNVQTHLKIGATYQWLFGKWQDSECHVYVRATVDGCNVFDARVRQSSQSRKSWWSTRRWRVVVDSAYVSKLDAESSGCPACCKAASCIEFDLYWETSDPFGSNGSGNALIRVCGDGEPRLLAQGKA